MDRFSELKTKGWVNLSKEERAEYNILKAGPMPRSEIAITPTPESMSELLTEEADLKKPAESDTVTVKKGELMQMVEEIAEAKIQKLREENQELKHSLTLERKVGLGEWSYVGDAGERKHTAFFRLWRSNTDEDFKIIVDRKHLRYDYDEVTRAHDKDIYKLTLMDDKGEKTEIELPHRDFAKISDIEIVDIIKMDKKEQVMVLGKVKRAARTRDGYVLSPGFGLGGLKLPDGQDWVDQTVTQDEITCTIRRKNGLQFQINANRLNGA